MHDDLAIPCERAGCDLRTTDTERDHWALFPALAGMTPDPVRR